MSHELMRRREFISLLGGAAAAWPLAAGAQQDGRVRRVGVLISATETNVLYQSYFAAFVQELRQLGWTDGQNLRLDVRWNAGDAGLSRNYAAQLIDLMPDVILASSTVNLIAITQATRTLPVVFVSVADPVTQGFVSNVRQPGGNVTGFSLYEFSLGSKWLALLKEIAPGVTRIAVMFNPEMAPYFEFFLPVLETAASLLGVHVIAVPIYAASDIEPALTSFARQPDGGLLLLGNLRSHEKLIADLAGRYRLPSIGPIGFATEGELMDYGPSFDLARHYRQAATYVDRILKGSRPGDLPIQAPTIYKFILNLKTAKALGLTVPLPLLGLADEVIE